MKKYITFILTSAFLLSTVFYACTQEGLPRTNTQALELDNFEADLQAVFKTVSSHLPKDQKLKKTQLTALFLQSTLSVFPASHAEESFKLNFLSGTSETYQKNQSRSEWENLIHASEDEQQVLQALATYLASDSYSLEQKREFLTVQKGIEFMAQHQEAFSLYFSGSQKQHTRAKSACGWWESWGNCTSGILSDLVSGATSGCEVGEAVGGSRGQETAGCIIGGAIGAFAGGLAGAVENCAGCEN